MQPAATAMSLLLNQPTPPAQVPDGSAAPLPASSYYYALERLERRLFEMNAEGTHALHELLQAYICGIEEMHPGIHCVLLLRRGQKLYPFACGSIASGFMDSLADGVDIADNTGTCGTAAYLRRMVVTTDISKDARWDAWRDHALAHQLRACWSTPILDNTGEVVATFGMYYHDVKAPSSLEENTILRAVHLLQVLLDNQRRAEQLHLSHMRYELLSQATHDAVWDWDIASDNCDYNSAFETLFGYGRDRTKNVWSDNLHADDRDRVLGGLFRARQDPAVFTWEMQYRFHRADGRIANVLDRASIVRDGSGQAIRMVGAMQDITPIKEAELELQHLSLIAKETVNGVIMTDAEERITWVNKAFTDITGYTSAEVLGRKPGDVLQGPQTRPHDRRCVRKSLAARESFTCEMLNYNRSGAPYWVEIKGQPVRNQRGELEYYFAILTDITEKKKLEQLVIEEKIEAQKEIAKAIINTQELERSEIGKELHDNVNQILTTAKLYVENISYYPAQGAEFVARSCALLQRSINEIRYLARQLVTPVLNDIGFRATIDELIAHYLSLGTFHVDFRYSLGERKLPRELQLTLYRIVQEQLNNIVKHADATSVELTIGIDSGHLRLAISDNGKGFDPGKTARGVGLKNIRNRADVYHGQLRLQSAPGSGCHLTVDFPVPQKARAQPSLRFPDSD
ncbi:PAS domain S-box protein [Flaviaesturariibacter aridisoli]|uniref:histidine kinase n=2 Tax=Flaviaesturariibacter aridisoli TaxID=2545761 RepID=A0A4R4E5N3_9BACT|nr:PAS domain S-box protein [Flaviaesturariibacter aridisoli]